MRFWFGAKTLISLIQKPSALHSSPGTLPNKSTLDIAERSQAIEGRVDPVVYRHVRRAHVVWIPGTFAIALPEISPRSATQTGVVMSAVDLPADVPAQSTSYKSIRSKMLIAGDSSKCHSGSQAIRKQLGERPRILVREHTGSRPGEHGMLGWKGSSATEKRAVTVALKRTLPLRDSFQCE